MIEIGKMNQLTICDENASGYYLRSDDSDEEVFLPPALLDQEVNVGDKLDVFIYLNSTGGLIATAEQPYAEVGQYALLTAIQVQEFGAFFEWGLKKDLLVPGNEQKVRVKMNEQHLVRICLEEDTNRIFGTTKIAQFIEDSEFDINEADKVTIVPVQDDELGFRCIVNKKYIGMIYHNEVFSKITLNREIPAVVKKIRVDGLVDLALQTQGINNLVEAKDIIIDMLEKRGGKSHLHDKSDPQEIRKILGMSKQTFKNSIGMLYKERKIIIKKDGIELVS